MPLRAGVIADDFTGATDIAGALVDGGLRTVQFSGAAHVPDHVDADAVVISLKTRSIPPGDAAAQTRHVLETIKGVVAAAGGSMDDVTFNHVFLKDWADYAAINGVYAEYFPGEKPARYCIQCGLVKPDALIEIASIAHIGQ